MYIYKDSLLVYERPRKVCIGIGSLAFKHMHHINIMRTCIRTYTHQKELLMHSYKQFDFEECSYNAYELYPSRD